LPHYGRFEDPDDELAHVSMAALCITYWCGAGGHGDESGIHERALERSARPLPDRRSADDADFGHAHCEKDFEDQNLVTDHADANHNRYLHFRLHLPRNAGYLLAALQAAECCY